MSADDEIIVVDNGSTDEIVAIVQKFEGVVLLKLPEATIWAVCNFGAKHSKNDILGFIDSDCLVCTGWRQGVMNQFNDLAVKAAGSVYDLPQSPTWVEYAIFSPDEGAKERPIFFWAAILWCAEQSLMRLVDLTKN